MIRRGRPLSIECSEFLLSKRRLIQRLSFKLIKFRNDEFPYTNGRSS